MYGFGTCIYVDVGSTSGGEAWLRRNLIGKFLIPRSSVNKQYNLVPSKAGAGEENRHTKQRAGLVLVVLQLRRIGLKSAPRDGPCKLGHTATNGANI